MSKALEGLGEERARKVMRVVSETGVSEQDARDALEAEEWIVWEAVYNISREFRAGLRQPSSR